MEASVTEMEPVVPQNGQVEKLSAACMSTETVHPYLCAPARDNKHSRRAYRNVYVDETPFGKGVFARRSFRPEDFVGRVTGAIVDDPDYNSDYCIELIKPFSLEPAQPFCYLNHSCDPNCELVWVEGKHGIPRVRIEVIRPIEPGEQLTIDYAWPAESAIRCGCGSQECRGWIVDEDELEEILG